MSFKKKKNIQTKRRLNLKIVAYTITLHEKNKKLHLTTKRDFRIHQLI